MVKTGRLGIPLSSPVLRRWLSCGALLLTIFLFHEGTIREGHAWGDDWAQYILHARNIATGRPYADTGYIFNPQFATLGPSAYPPGFPLLLAPIWAARGMDLHAMKTLGVVCFAVSLGLIYGLYARGLGALQALALVAVLGFCPLFWQQKDYLGSDLPFLMLLYLTLFAVHKALLRERPRHRDAVVIALLILITASIRTVGLVLLPAVVCGDLLKIRRVSRFTAVTVLLAGTAYAIEAGWIHSIGASVSLFDVHLRTVTANVLAYEGLLRTSWAFGGHRGLSGLLNALLAGAVLIGIADRIRSREALNAAEVFAILYLGVLLVYMPVEFRFLFPLLPVYVALSLRGLSMGNAVPRAVSYGILVLVFVGYAAEYRRMDFGPLHDGLGDRDFVQATGFIRNQTRADEVVLFRKPRVLTLLTGRKAATYAYEPGLGRFIENLRPGIIVASTSAGDSTFASDAEFLWPFLRAYPDRLELIYSNAGYRVFRMRW